MGNNELSICGIKAVNALFKKNPDRINRLYFNEDAARMLSNICKYLASKKKIYRLVKDDELQKISDSVHHGGVVAVINTPRLLDVNESVVNNWLKNNSNLLVMDGISNAHNLGAIVRSAAFFGFSEIILCDAKGSAKPTPSSYRIAEGGMEFVNLYNVETIPGFLDKISSSFYIVGTSLQTNNVLGKKLIMENKGKPFALVLGNEEEGMSTASQKKCHMLLKIPGTGNIESLNVTAAASVFMHYISFQKQ